VLVGDFYCLYKTILVLFIIYNKPSNKSNKQVYVGDILGNLFRGDLFGW
jgi:hypothetical protein